jgi:Na+/proline symporter
LQRYEFQSPRSRTFERIRKWVALTCLTIGASIFWGALFAGLVKYAFDLSQEQARVILIPAAIAVSAYLYFNRHKLARALGFDD